MHAADALPEGRVGPRVVREVGRDADQMDEDDEEPGGTRSHHLAGRCCICLNVYVNIMYAVAICMYGLPLWSGGAFDGLRDGQSRKSTWRPISHTGRGAVAQRSWKLSQDVPQIQIYFPKDTKMRDK